MHRASEPKMGGPFDFQRAVPIPKDRQAFVSELKRLHGMDRAAAEQLYEAQLRAVIWKSSRYQVTVTDPTPNGFGLHMTHLSIRRLDRAAIHDWRDLQRIKNAIVGAECEALEIYPAESRLVDTANQYHLFAFLDPSVRIPCGFMERLVSEASFMDSVQRPFDPSTGGA